MKNGSKPKISVFHCINVFNDGHAFPATAIADAELNFIKLPCSSMVKDVFLLRAFEAGADAVAVLVCAEGACRYVEGNLRAKKRVQWIKSLLDDIGLDGKRLALFNVKAGDMESAERFIRETYLTVAALGPNPATSGRQSGIQPSDG